MSSILYCYGSTYYINLTNRCPCKCVFCVRNQFDTLGDADCLWLDREPTADEIKDALRSVDLSESDEVVFCGYGEPTERLDVVLDVAEFIHGELRKRTRLDTNGLGCLINGRDIVPELVGKIDTVSVSLNAPNEEEYLRVTKPSFGPGSYDAMLSFARECRAAGIGLRMSVVSGFISDQDVQRCASIVDSLGGRFRVRRTFRYSLRTPFILI